MAGRLGFGMGLGITGRRSSGGGGSAAWHTTLAGLRDLTIPNGRTSGAALKIPGVDSQSGFSWNAGTKTMTITGVSIPLVTDWDFTNCTVVIGSDTVIKRFTQCLFGETPGTFAGVSVYLSGSGGTSTIRLLDYCTFTGPQHHFGAGKMIDCGIWGPNDGSAVPSNIDRIYYCRFLNASGDVVKAGGSNHYNGQRMEYCYIGPPRNLIAAPVAWSAATTYALNDIILGADGIRLYVSLQNGNLNNVPPVHPTTSTAFWELRDIHGDAVTLPINRNRFSIRNCIIDWTDDPPGAGGPYTNVWGVNNNIRWARNDPTGNAPCGPSLIEYLICPHIVSNSPALSIGTGRDDPQVMKDVLVGLNTTGAAFYPVTVSGDLNYQIRVLNIANNAAVALEAGASSTDMSAAPANTVAPTLTGTLSVGSVITATIGTWTGFPEPFYSPVLQISADGSTGWTDVAGFDADTLLYTTVTGDGTKYLRLKVTADNSTSSVITYSSVVGPIAAGYAQNFVDTNATAVSSFTGTGTATKFEMSGWLKIQSAQSNAKLLRVSAGADIWLNMNTGVLTVSLSDSAGTTVYTATSPSSTFVLSTRTFFYVGADWSTGSPTVTVQVNGSTVTMTPSVGPLVGSGSLRPARTYGLLATIGAAAIDTHVSDLWVDFHSTSMLGAAALYNGGTPPNPTALGRTPLVLRGGAMKADADTGGNTAQGWNDAYNLGSLAVTVNNASYTDA